MRRLQGIYSLNKIYRRLKKYREEKNSQEIGDREVQLKEEFEKERRLIEEQTKYNQKAQRFSHYLYEILTHQIKQREQAQGQVFRILDQMNHYLNHEFQHQRYEKSQ